MSKFTVIKSDGAFDVIKADALHIIDDNLLFTARWGFGFAGLESGVAAYAAGTWISAIPDTDKPTKES